MCVFLRKIEILLLPLLKTIYSKVATPSPSSLFKFQLLCQDAEIRHYPLALRIPQPVSLFLHHRQPRLLQLLGGLNLLLDFFRPFLPASKLFHSPSTSFSSFRLSSRILFLRAFRLSTLDFKFSGLGLSYSKVTPGFFMGSFLSPSSSLSSCSLELHVD